MLGVCKRPVVLATISQVLMPNLCPTVERKHMQDFLIEATSCSTLTSNFPTSQQLHSHCHLPPHAIQKAQFQLLSPRSGDEVALRTSFPKRALKMDSGESSGKHAITLDTTWKIEKYSKALIRSKTCARLTSLGYHLKM